MLIYLSIFATLTLVGFSFNDKQARLTLPLLLLFLLFFMGTRYYVGCDFTGYLNRFENPNYFDFAWEDVVEGEAGFNALLHAIRDADLEYMWLNVFCSAIFLACTWVFCRAHPRPVMVLAVLFPVVILQLAMSGLRQAVALGFVMVATVQFMQGRRLATALMILAGSTFHTSAVALFPIAFLAGRRITSLKLVAAVVLLTPVAALLLGSRLDVYIDRYVDEEYGEMSSGGAVFRYLLVLIPATWFLWHRQRVQQAAPRAYPLLLLFAIIILALAPVGLVSTVALHRLTYYVMPVSVLMFIYTSLVLSRSRTSIRILIPAGTYALYNLSWLMTSRHASICYIPYRTYMTQ